LEVVAETLVCGGVSGVPGGEPVYLRLGLVDAYLAQVYLVYLGEVFLEALRREACDLYVQAQEW
jgi:hypothetical protein